MPCGFVSDSSCGRPLGLCGDWWFSVHAAAVGQEAREKCTVCQAAFYSRSLSRRRSGVIIFSSLDLGLVRPTADRKEALHTSGNTRGSLALAAAAAQPVERSATLDRYESQVCAARRFGRGLLHADWHPSLADSARLLERSCVAAIGVWKTKVHWPRTNTWLCILRRHVWRVRRGIISSPYVVR